MTEENKDTLKEGGIRLLTSGETELAKSVFGSTIQYHTVWIHHGSYLPFNLQDEHTAMTPNGELYFRYWYRDDFSSTVPHLQHLFIHEMCHVWQRAKGMNVIARGLISWLVSYRYQLDGRLLCEYPMEQQAQIIADNFSLQTEGYNTWRDLLDSTNVTIEGDISEGVVRQKYTEALRGFPW
ncbi:MULTISPECIES: hypothetical protein [Yersinia]|uniref:Type IV secretion protein Rhs n=1 Tax=Yersinia pekkanenii TaxID=1288385 RepID=A0A0T9RJ73_9GAMM|nr:MULTISPECIES: hypothetical protein [Yersinia]CNF71056.1 Uncharacterised protein [Yersinia bercovieri]CNI66053.1 Uncharacterised protein [Yersinia pekkanenii]CRY69568.1 Uncharacterised protein [Yersinia pekkanenii]HEO0718500.1 type IV secretion protein Rhs [Yersinia enterocolitica]